MTDDVSAAALLYRMEAKAHKINGNNPNPAKDGKKFPASLENWVEGQEKYVAKKYVFWLECCLSCDLFVETQASGLSMAARGSRCTTAREKDEIVVEARTSLSEPWQ